jgi:hypothetical protein
VNQVKGTAASAVASLALFAFGPVACAGQPKDPSRISESSQAPEAFDGELRCPIGDEHGEAFWDYGANPRGTIVDPVRWMRKNAVGLDPSLTLSFVEKVGDLEDVVVVMNRGGLALAFVEFGREGNNRFFPNHAESCSSTGIDDFT